MRTSHLALFEEPNVVDVAAHLREQDVIWVDRGSVVNLMAVWRAHGLPDILTDCWRLGVVLAGESAGSLCWHTCTVTDSYGGLRGVADGLGLLPYANAVHYGEGRSACLRSSTHCPPFDHCDTWECRSAPWVT